MTDSYYSDLLETTKQLDDMKEKEEIAEPPQFDPLPEVVTVVPERKRIEMSDTIVSVTGYKIAKPVLYSVTIENNEGTYEVWRRYKQFLTLHTSLQGVTKRYTFPPFPQKLMFGNKNEENIKKRMNMLDIYLQRVSGELEFVKTDAYKKFIQK